MPHTRLIPKPSFTSERLEALRAAVPEAFADGSINWETLRECLADRLEPEDERAEHFGLSWPGKREARRLASLPSSGALLPVPNDGVNDESSDNLVIEGDNLEVLKLLQKAYAGRVRMIYVDPPYNTGNDFVYRDDFADPLRDYLRLTGQADEKGALTTNSRADGRFHSNWLSMMYPRLRLARSLLREDGFIFVSIDDGEVNNLRLLMNEVFGEESFVEQIVWKNKYGSGALTKGFANVHEYVLCYARGSFSSLAAPLDEEEIAKYKARDDKFDVRGGFVTQPLATTSKDDRPNLRYPIKWKGKEIWPEKQWIWSRERVERAIANDEVVFSEKDGKVSVRTKQYLRDENGVLRKGKPVSILNGPFNQEGTAEITELLGKDVYDFPKPSSLIKYFYSFVVNDVDDRSGLFLDFFAGSGTSAHAVLQLNREDGGTRRFIAVQLPEPCPEDSVAKKAGYDTIVEITKERLRRVIKKLKGKSKAASNEDLGFRVFRLAPSNFKAWQDFKGDGVEQLQMAFDEAQVPLVKGWTESGLTTEVMLLEGFPLASAVKRIDTLKNNSVFSVTSDACEHRLLICLDAALKESTVGRLDFHASDVFVCLDSALTDETKQSLADACTLKTI